MYKVKFTSTFKKSYKLMKKRGLDIRLLDNVIDMLRQGQTLDIKYRDHALTGNYEGYRECHIKPDWLLIYYIENDMANCKMKLNT
ncbi:type II toxin-antitoxin system YafQ family toxin [Veillonella sp.]|uniref:type II toxin-antitoxin system YafQ family toxin n=1 Tax=Veillonella sp. TaxID=1926307 RepID=UPI00257CB2DE|nr:type II toxin-antitoxin system YafQ family toxin [Veillonella sp.]MBS6227107.1 type II toxin-antitoxin system YafQ family toxin [Veillonella sp.]